ncbi:conjugal transfer protein TraN (plasmid) [Novosphingobium aerophilum]|jgi:conjugal transfer mating pair stabilization protein TraN|uniref:Conjugal transfer protein TraN n=1 Tax=Novosphingobium aquiterrae TaxID=624388 RepID=A0ABV6PIC3_9SPHN
MRLAIAISLAVLAGASFPAQAQTTLEEAREQGKAMGTAAKANPVLVPSDNAQAEAVPGFSGTTLPQGSYFDDPDKLINDAQALKSSSEQYQITTDSGHVRPTFSNAEILSTTNRATTIEEDPSTYLAGEAYGGTSGSCTALPPGSGTSGYYEASCNAGAKVTTNARNCTVNLDVRTDKRTIYTYYTGRLSFLPSDGGPYPARAAFDDEIASGVCWESRPIDYCDNMAAYGYTAADTCKSLGHTAVEVKCSAEAQGITEGAYHPGTVISTGNYWLTRQEEPAVPVITRNEGLCAAYAGDSNCALESEICTASDPVTRIVDGVPVTQPCWAWQRSYQCHTISSANDCSELEANGSCTYQRTECLDEDPDGGPCKVQEKIYRCPTPSGTSADAPQYICGDDVYCINGDCEPIERQASTEFKDALVALHSIDQAGKEFDETNYRVFSGTRETCHKPVFGLINCCAGKVSGLVPVAAGAAALAGGPAAIAAFATPFLVLFACSQDEMRLDIKDRMGFCHNLGTYCSSSFLGICKTKRTAYCCFESKLSRILQEQGRVQLGKPWGAPKKEQCQGFTIEEFASLDLSVMDFTEIYSDFLDAAKLPDEVQTMTDIQSKIQDYYDLHGK